jgi:SAM-dependent MidA family methyltransferase
MTKSLSYDRSIASDNPVTAEELCSGEGILARLVAAAYAADHPESFGKKREEVLEEKELTARRQEGTLQAGGTTSCGKQPMAPDHTA